MWPFTMVWSTNSMKFSAAKVEFPVVYKDKRKGEHFCDKLSQKTVTTTTTKLNYHVTTESSTTITINVNVAIVCCFLVLIYCGGERQIFIPHTTIHGVLGSPAQSTSEGRVVSSTL